MSRSPTSVFALVRGRVTRAAAWADERLEQLRLSMTPGQRWTSTFAIGLALTVLLFGMPHQVIVDEFGSASGEGQSRPLPPTGDSGAIAAASSNVPVFDDILDLVADSGDRDDVPPDGAAPAVTVPVAEPTPRVVALVRRGASPVPGRDDADVAKVFVDRAGFPVTTVTYEPARADLCTEVAAAGDVVVASRGLDSTLRDCLVGAGVVVVAFDDSGDRPPVPAARGQVVSTRRGLAVTIDDLGQWAVATGSLGGRVGVVASASVRPVVDPAVVRLLASGIDVTATAYLSDGAASAAEIADQVRAFSAKGVEVIVFVVPVEQQRRWVAQQAALRPVRYVVADAFDAVANETYPTAFDGAVAYTSLRVPWYQRDRGETPAQSFCRQQWSETGRALIGGDEVVRVFAWCQHIALVAGAIRSVEQGEPLRVAVRTQAVASPLTSDLGPLVGDGYGPREDAVVVWRSACACWKESRAYESRD